MKDRGKGTQPSVDERYTQWKSLVPVLYDWLANHNLVWPSLSCRWGPQLEQATYKNRQRLYLSEQTDGSVPNTLVIANCEVVKPRVAAAEHISQFNEEARSPFVKKFKTIIHPGEVNRIRELPQNSKIVATHTDSPDVLIWDVEAQPNRHAVLGTADSRPDLILTGHQDNAEFALAMCPTEPFVLSGGKDKLVVLWSIQDHISASATEPSSTKSPGIPSGGSIIKPASKNSGSSDKAADDPSIGPRGVYQGHDDTVEDVQFCPSSSQVFCSVGDDSCLILWDARTGSTPSVKVEKAHNADLHCVDWNPHDENLILTGSADNSVRMFDRRNLTSSGVGSPVYKFEGHKAAVLCVPELPPASLDERKKYMERLADSRPDKKYWEAGGNCNLAIAAARLGLHCVTLGHVGSEIYGHFLLNVLQEEGIVMVGMNEDTEVAKSSSYETLLCWVLVDSLQRHGFCSRADFSKEPAFSWMSKLTGEVKMAIKQSKILFFNGYVFDELFPGLITTTLEYAIDVGTAIFFDPGPRGKYLIHGTPEQQKAITLLLKMSDVLLLTADEAEALTGKTNPILAGQDLIRNGMCVKWVIIKMGAHGSILITASTITCAPAFKVDVVDTVGCGDSCTAAVVVGFLHGISPVGTLALTNAVGAATAMGCGAGRNVATSSKVLELLRVSNLNEDDELWNDLIENVDATEISLLSKTVINGCCDRLSRVPMQIVVSELLPKLETLLKRRAVPSQMRITKG